MNMIEQDLFLTSAFNGEKENAFLNLFFCRMFIHFLSN